MKILFFANLRDYTNCKETSIEDCAAVEELIHLLCAKFGRKFQSKVMKGDAVSDEIIILVNGRNIYNLDGVKTSLDKDDVISIFPVVAGG